MRNATRQLCGLLAFAWIAAIPSAHAQVDGCTYNRTFYPEGTEMCQSGARVRCTAGAWGTIGMCDAEDASLPGPIAEGGDLVAEDEDVGEGAR